MKRLVSKAAVASVLLIVISLTLSGQGTVKDYERALSLEKSFR